MFYIEFKEINIFVVVKLYFIQTLVAPESRPQNINEFEARTEFPRCRETASTFLIPNVREDIKTDFKSLKFGKSLEVDITGRFIFRHITGNKKTVLLSIFKLSFE